MSTINVNAIDKESGSTLTLGGSGTTVNVSNMVPDVALSNRNLIIGGAMNVAQRGTSSTTNGYGTVDRMSTSFGHIFVTQTQETLSSGDPYDLGFRKFFRATNTSVSAATNASCQFYQKIEAQNVACSGWNYLSSSSYITLSFWVRSSLAGTYSGFLYSEDGTPKANSFQFTLSANTWTKVTKTFSGDSSIQIDNDNGPGLGVFIVPYYGTDFTTSGHTNDVWQTYASADSASDFAQNWCNTASATFDLTGIQLEVGSVATPFEHESFAETLQKCKRYYQKSYNLDAFTGATVASGQYLAQRFNSADRYFVFNKSFPVEMRNTPTLVVYDRAGNSSSINTYNSSVNLVSISSISGTTHKAIATYLDNNSGSGTDDLQGFHFTADAEL